MTFCWMTCCGDIRVCWQKFTLWKYGGQGNAPLYEADPTAGVGDAPQYAGQYLVSWDANQISAARRA